MRSIKKDYLNKRYQKRLLEEDDLTVSELPEENHFFWERNLTRQCRNIILKLRDYGCAINTTIVIAVARG